MRFPGSSMVERSAVNRNVAGSSPALGANLFNHFQKLGCPEIVQLSVKCPCSHFLPAVFRVRNLVRFFAGSVLRYASFSSIAFRRSSSFTML